MNGVAIAGKAGAGKNAYADHLCAELVRRGLWPTQVGFAEGPKAELLETRGLRKEDPGGRDALVELAHSRRSEDPRYWISRLSARLDSLSPYGAVPVITDMRYQNEIEWARAAGFVTVRVDASLLDRGVVLLNRGEDPAFAESDHPSECELDEAEFDVRFYNPHGPGFFTLMRYAVHVADLLVGDAELAA